jgi:hypothetical protein
VEILEHNVPVVRTCLLPTFRNSPFEAVAVKYLDANYWKFQQTIGDWEDAIQEAAYCYYWTRNRYGARVQTPQHFMALFKRCLHSWFTDWANLNTREVSVCQTYKPEIMSTPQTEAHMKVLLNYASRELKSVLEIIFNSPREVLTVLKTDARESADSFWKNAVKFSGMEEKAAPVLEAELRNLLS